MRRVFLLLWIILSAVMPAAAQPAAWPSRPVTLVFPFAPGGAEGFIRVLAQALSERLGQPFVLEIRSGAGGAIGSVQVANAAPDGYTLLVTYVGPAVLNKLLYKSIPYDPDTEFEPVALLSEVPQVIVSSPKLGFKTLADLIAYGKANPDTLTVAHPGAGTMGHLAAALFLSRAGITGSLVGYRGSTPAITDILSGHIMAGVPAYIPVVETVTRLAVTSEERVGFLPDVPTARESGIDVVASTWGALVGPQRHAGRRGRQAQCGGQRLSRFRRGQAPARPVRHERPRRAARARDRADGTRKDQMGGRHPRSEGQGRLNERAARTPGRGRMIEQMAQIATRAGPMDAFVTHPEEGGPFPAVIVYMDIWGLREELFDIARRIATVGYHCTVPNLYYRQGKVRFEKRDARGRMVSFKLLPAEERERMMVAAALADRRDGDRGHRRDPRFPAHAAGARRSQGRDRLLHGRTPRALRRGILSG